MNRKLHRAWKFATLVLSAGVLAPGAHSQASLGDRARAFSPRAYSTMTTAQSLDCGDLDADGRLDVLWCTNSAPYVYVARGLPGGELALPIPTYAWPNVPPPPQTAPAAIAPIAADLDLDGILDIVCAYKSTGNYGWLRGTGAGAFAPVQVFYQSAVAMVDPDLEVADLNGDSLPDLLIAVGAAGRVAWVPGTGGGAMGSAVTIWNGQRPERVCVGDLDADSDLDIAIALATGNAVAVLVNDGVGGFTTAQVLPAGVGPLDVATGDFDGDGRADLVSADSSDGTLSVFFGALGGGFSPRTILTAGGMPRSLATPDLDQDGLDDIVVGTGTNNDAGSALRWRALGGQTFGASEFVMASCTARQVRVRDLDGDGALDVLAIDHSTPAVNVAFARTPGVFEPGSLAALSGLPWHLDLADFDEDGRLDVLETEVVNITRLVRVMRSDGLGGLTPLSPQPGGSDPIATIARDADGDGHCDALTVDRPMGEVRWARGDGAGNLAPPQIVAMPGASAITAGAEDLDGDGVLDLVVALPAPPRVAVLKGTGGGAFAPAVFVPTPGDTYSFDFADVDEDGSIDVLANCWPHPQLALGDGLGGLGPWQAVTPIYGPSALGLADLNADGHVDLFLSTGGTTGWSFGTGTGTFGPESYAPHPLPQSASSIAAADVDCDGRMDIVVGATLVGVHYGNAQGGFDAPLVHGIGRGWVNALADMNGDGRIDFVAQDRQGKAISVQLNRGPSCPPSTYCVAKVNSLGCTPAIGSSGDPSAGATSGFVISCAQVRNQKVGLLFYGFDGAAQVPMVGGFRCVNAPIRRAITQNAGGSPAPANDCSGLLSMDWNAFAHGLLGGNPAPGASTVGAEVHSQWWARDQGFAPPDNHSLSDGLRFTIQP